MVRPTRQVGSSWPTARRGWPPTETPGRHEPKPVAAMDRNPQPASSASFARPVAVCYGRGPSIRASTQSMSWSAASGRAAPSPTKRSRKHSCGGRSVRSSRCAQTPPAAGTGLLLESQMPSRIFHEVTLVTYAARKRSPARKAAAILLRALSNQWAVSRRAPAGGSYRRSRSSARAFRAGQHPTGSKRTRPSSRGCSESRRGRNEHRVAGDRPSRRDEWGLTGREFGQGNGVKEGTERGGGTTTEIGCEW